MDIKNSDVIYTGEDSIIYKGIHPKYKDVAIKMVRTDHPTEGQLERILNEYGIGAHLEFDGIRKVLELTKINNKQALILELVDGSPIKQNLHLFSSDINLFLEIAIKIANSLANLHENNIIHKDLNSNNILLTTDVDIKIIDFGISSKFDKKNKLTANPINLEGTLEYISPEQTGRTNRKVHQNSDLYSLGVILYEMITGQLPFKSDDPFELVHLHIAQIPISPNKINSNVPQVISNVIMKLLSKNSQDRYQSAVGLEKDLEIIHTAFPNLSELSNLSLAQHDYSSELTIPDKLYGRNKEKRLISERFKRVIQGTVELIYLEGKAGVGKSALIHELQPLFIEKKAIYLEGKFEQFDKNVPYSALMQAFSSFIEITLNETEENLEYWKNRIQLSFGNIGKVITDNFPAIRALVGAQPELPELTGEEAKNRFNLAWTNLLKAISSESHPLVLFIDDLQWADLSSIELLRSVLNDTSNNHLLCIVASRPLEESGALPIQLVSENEEWVSRINLENLESSAIQELIKDSIDLNKSSPLASDDLNELATMICDKTSGNIFFAIQLIESLASQKLIQLDKTKNIWIWDIAKIKEQKITNNVVDLITKNLNKLPPESLSLLQTAAAKGNSFNSIFLSEIEEKSEEEITSLLEPALLERIIYIRNRHSYHFIHDKIYSAVYKTIPEEEKQKLHLKIGLFLKNKNTDANRDELFELTNHLNVAVELIDVSDKNDLVHLNYIAGKRAVKSVAFEAANNYFTTAISLNGESFWKENYELCLDLHDAVLIPAVSLGEYEWTETICQQIIKNANNKLDKTNAYLAQLNSLVAQGKYIETNNLGLKILGEFGIKIPSNPNMVQVGALLMKAKSALRGKEMKDILNLPKMTDKEISSVMLFLNPLITSTYLTSLNLNLVISLTGFIQTLKFGRSRKSAYYITSYGGVMAYLNKYDRAYEFGETALELVKKRTPSLYYGREYVIALLFTIPFKKGLVGIYNNFYKIYENCIERGDWETAGWGLTNFYFYKYYSNGKLTELLEQHSNELETFKKINNDFSETRFKALIQFADDLVYDESGLKDTDNELSITRSENKYFPENEIQSLLESKDLGNIGYFFTYAIQRNCLKRDYKTAIDLIDKIQPNLVGIMGLYILSVYYLYSSLTILSAPKSLSNKFSGLVKKNQKKLALWAKACPENFQHKHDLVNALIHQKKGKIDSAKHYFEKAIIGAQRNEFICEEAVAWELGAELFEESKIHFQAEFYFQNAYNSYKKWGASANCKRLEKYYPAYSFDLQHQSRHSTRVTASSTSGLSFNQNMDLNSVIKASQSISREVKQEDLLKSLMHTIMENAGAENGLFIQNDSGKLRIEADCSITRDENIFLGGFDISKFNSPQGLLRYVLRTKKELVLNDALKDETYRFDEYIQSNQVKSILCFPVVHKNSVIAILYLENNQGTHAFTSDHLDTIRLLSSQVAISLENSSLYQSLEDKVEDRTRKLNQAHEEIKDSIVYAKRIQTAILPQPSFLVDKFKKGFVLFKPKDVVSGDFFWFKEVDNILLFAAADCTGHGVPGAMVSVICNAALNRSVREFGIVDPGKLLDKTKELVIEVFEKSEEKVQDGMDISICALNTVTKELRWAGANNSLYCIKKIQDDTPQTALKKGDHYLHEIKPNVQPIGIYEKDEQFKTHSLQMEQGNTIYLFTDGYADQFGGKKGKKLKTKNFKKLLLENFHLNPEDQKNILDNEFENWRGNKEQLDDVCVIGLKF